MRSMKNQATPCTQRQLAYLAYWQQRGYHFGRDDVIPEDISIPPNQWRMPSWVDLAATSFVLAALFAWGLVAQ
ncbi:hypothetical protein MAJJADAN_00004 [Pseudomonas phage Amjad_SA]|nr:hypothetical protein MAJJADAN_00004 [Pseudomonas phage Amjad_SA]